MIAYSSGTYIGNREINEDSFITLSNESRYCFVLADGLGGHGKGEVASGLAVKVFEESFANWKQDESMEQFIGTTIEKAQMVLLEEQKRQRASMDMKTTLVVLCCDGQKICWAHVGDSRLYAFQKNKVKCRTLDHSVPQMLALAGDIKEKHIRKHPDRNRLLKVMGIEWDGAQYELGDVKDLSEYQAFLLCSDGFWEWIDEKKMGATLKKSKSPDEWLQKMMEIVLKQGLGNNMDNSTAVVVFCD